MSDKGRELPADSISVYLEILINMSTRSRFLYSFAISGGLLKSVCTLHERPTKAGSKTTNVPSGEILGSVVKRICKPF
jgi:hypothetical protein